MHHKCIVHIYPERQLLLMFQLTWIDFLQPTDKRPARVLNILKIHTTIKILHSIHMSNLKADSLEVLQKIFDLTGLFGVSVNAKHFNHGAVLSTKALLSFYTERIIQRGAVSQSRARCIVLVRGR